MSVVLKQPKESELVNNQQDTFAFKVCFCCSYVW